MGEYDVEAGDPALTEEIKLKMKFQADLSLIAHDIDLLTRKLPVQERVIRASLGGIHERVQAIKRTYDADVLRMRVPED